MALSNLCNKTNPQLTTVKGHNTVLSSSFGPARVSDCQTCAIAWLYQDAKMFGWEQYKNLAGENNVICPGEIGPVLETNDYDFISLMEKCPCESLLKIF